MENQQELPGIIHRNTFFQQVRNLELKSDQTAIIALMVMYKQNKILSSKKIRKKIGPVAKKNKINTVATLSPVFKKLIGLGLIERIENKHQYKLTQKGIVVSKSCNAILSIFGSEPKQLQEQTKQESVDNIPDKQRIEGLLKQIEEQNEAVTKANEERDQAIKISDQIKNVNRVYQRMIPVWTQNFPGKEKYGTKSYGEAIMKKLLEFRDQQEKTAKEALAISRFRDGLIILFKELKRDWPEMRKI